MHLRHFAYVVVFPIALAGQALGQDREEIDQSKDYPSPASIIGARCVFCHGPTVMLSFSHKLLAEAGQQGLDDFLRIHHAPDKEARDAIVQFFLNPSGSSN